jgi:hypothetical protein
MRRRFHRRAFFLDEFLFAGEMKGKRQNSRCQGAPNQGGGFGGSPPLGCTGVTTVSPFAFR